MRIHVCGREAVETMTAPDEPFIVISISSGDAPPANVPDAPHRLGVLRLWFDDFNPEKAVLGSRAREGRAFTDEYARQIWEFVETHRQAAQHLVVHCDAGISRSPAVAAGIAWHLVGSNDEYFERYIPNAYVYRVLMRNRSVPGDGRV